MRLSAIRQLSRLWPLSTPERPPLRSAMGFLGWSLTPAALLGASYASAAILTLVGLTAGLLLDGIAGIVIAGGCLLGSAVALAAGRIVELLARVRRASALGDAPAVITRATVRMQVSPAPESAAAFAARSMSGRLAESLLAHVRRTAAGPNTALGSFAREWGEWLGALERACSLVESAGHEPSADRSATLERARRVVLDGIEDRTAAFAASIRGPVTALYAFGVLLPLSLVALLPALDAAGFPASMTVIVVGYDLLLPVVVVSASAWLLAKRPVAFRPTPIGRSHPDVATEWWHAGVAGAGCGLVGWWLTGLVLPGWVAPLVAVGAGAGTALLVAYWPMQSVRERGDAVEAGLSDGLSLIGRRVERGMATERALQSVAGEIPGATGDVFATAARRQRRLGLDIETAFTGPDGALATVPSERARSVASLLALSARAGRPAGTALTAMGEHLETLDAVERESKRAVERLTSTLSNTAAVFGPLVGGATVALTDALGRGGPMATAIPAGDLGLAVGCYVLVLAVVLTALSTGLTHGLDRSLVGYRIGLALLAATATYVTAFVAAGLLV